MDILKYAPIYGNIIIAVAFNKNTKLTDATKSSFLAPKIGDKAPIAVAPQIAVPETIKIFRFFGSFNAFPRIKPKNIIART